MSSSMEPWFLKAGSDGAGGTTRSKETKRFDGDSGLSHRMMIMRRPGAGVQGAEDSGAVSSASAFTWNDMKYAQTRCSLSERASYIVLSSVS